MPLPRQQVSAEQLEQRKKIIHELLAAGVIQNYQRAEKYGLDSGQRFEMACFGQTGLVNPTTYAPTTAAEWIADCTRRSVVPYVPNID